MLEFVCCWSLCLWLKVMNMLVAILWRLHPIEVHNYYVSGHPVEVTPIGLFGNVGIG